MEINLSMKGTRIACDVLPEVRKITSGGGMNRFSFLAGHSVEVIASAMTDMRSQTDRTLSGRKDVAKWTFDFPPGSHEQRLTS
ncbi:hypothetical protein V6N12_028185 [Hibiscus sabdariffa]|uniref:Uncharacterized protein n=1 Tax=Hibiscus sabdariffa TaxID=183260 RepID=A0ABR2F525_9ROSI